MIAFFKTAQENEYDARRLQELESKMVELQRWCSFDSPEIGHAIAYLLSNHKDVSAFRKKLRGNNLDYDNGEVTK